MAQFVRDLGDIVRLSVNFKVNGILTDPTGVTATVRKPDGTTTAYAYPATIVKDGVGLYHLDVTVDQSGEWTYKFVGTGTAADVGPGIFYVKPDPTADSPYLYVSVDALKATLKIVGTDSDPDVALAIEAASRAVDAACGRRFYTMTETRYYTVDATGRVRLDDLATATAITADLDSDGVYETTWTTQTDYLLGPPNAALNGAPYNELLLQATYSPYPWGYPYAPTLSDRFIKIEGDFGWPTVPPGIRKFTEILAAKLLRRSTDAPYGFVLSGNDLGSMTRLTRTDPDFDLLVGPYRREPIVA
jgi:hypothetical protein